MRVAMINLQFGAGTTKGYWHYATTVWKYLLPHSGKHLEKAAAMLRNESVDIAICTEVSNGSLRSGYASQTELVRDAAAMEHAHFFPAIPSRLWDEGIALLSRYEIQKTALHTLSGGSVPRILAEAVLAVHGRTVTVFGTHLALGKSVRHAQMKEVADIMATANGPVILCGDFNERDLTSFHTKIGHPFQYRSDLPTYPSWGPRHSLQHLLFSEEFTVNTVFIPDVPSQSDHAPLMADISLR